MIRRLAALAAVLLVAPATVADYTHTMADAARTATASDGPDAPDTAWRRTIGGTRAALQPPLIHDGEVFVAALDDAADDPRADLWRFDLTTGEGGVWLSGLEAVRYYDDYFWFLMSIGSGQLVVNTAHGLAGYDLDGGDSPRWTWKAGDEVTPPSAVDPLAACPGTAVAGGWLVAPCTLLGTSPSDASPRTRGDGSVTGEYRSFVAGFRIDGCMGSCRPAWVWHRDATTLADWPAEGGPRPSGPGEAPAPVMMIAAATTVGDGMVAVLFVDYQVLYEVADYYLGLPRVNHGSFSLWVLDVEDGSLRWDDRGTTWASVPRDDGDIVVPGHAGDFGYAHMPRFTDGLLLHTTDRQLRGTGIGTWTGWGYDIGGPTDRVGFAINSITVRDQDVYVASMDKLFRIDLTTQVELAQGSASGPGADPETWVPLSPFLLADDTIYASSIRSQHERSAFFDGGSSITLHAMDADTLDPRWRLLVEDASRPRRDTPAADWAVSDGSAVLHTRSGDVVALGGDARPLDATGPDAYPAPGATVSVDILAQADRYLVDWGDGSRLAWTDDPSARHSYERRGDYAVTAIAEADGWWTSRQWTVHVGGTPPTRPGLLESAFARENQDLTFGVLGIGLALAGGLFAVGRGRWRHGRLEKEMAAIDAAVEPVKESPSLLREVLDERRTHCRAMLRRRRIDGLQFAVLERHIDSIGRGQRLDQLRGLFEFVPYGVIAELEAMLADGRISAVERRGIEALLRDNPAMTAAQKRKVASLIDDWFEQDDRRTG